MSIFYRQCYNVCIYDNMSFTLTSQQPMINNKNNLFDHAMPM